MDDVRAKLRESFDLSASVYDQIRPGYPKALVTDIIELSEIPGDGRILEIGCGTGKATEPFAECGYSMDCLEIGEELAKVARAKFSDHNNVQVFVSSFEAWQAPEHRYDLIIAATSFSWVDPTIGYVKSAALLKSTGSLAVFSNTHTRKSEGFFARVQDVYRTRAPSMAVVTATRRDARKDPVGTSLFEDPVIRRYAYSIEYDANQYLKLLSTYSDHISLPDSEKDALFTGIAEVIDAEYGGKVLKHYEAVLDLRRLRSQ